MNFLYPLLLAGVAAIAAPIVLHMIRRHTRSRVVFSSLMFLRSTMPRLRNRSRLEHIPLLILRCLIVCLLAFAFARPFLSRPVAVSESAAGRRIVLLLDTSASMRREGLWPRAVEEAKAIIADVGSADRLCVMSFDQSVQTLIGFDRWKTMDPAQRTAIVTADVEALSPGWVATDLGRALVAAAEAIEDDEVSDGLQAAGSRRIVLVSDLQQGGKLDALLAYEWPKQTELVLSPVSCQGTTNASMQLLTSSDALTARRGDDLPRVRVTNSAEADKDRFQLRWGAGAGQAVDVYVPPGHSVVVPVPTDSGQSNETQDRASRLVLTGDDHDFDNVLYVAAPPQRPVEILYIGRDDPNNTEQMLYYIRRAFETEGTPASRVHSQRGDESLRAEDIAAAQMIVVADALSQPNAALLRRHVESGGVLLLVLTSDEAAASLSELAGIAGLSAREADVRRYAMFDRIEFSHPLLKPFSDPRFADFTRIHFWKYRRVDVADCPGARVLAWFDTDDPAWFEIPTGRGSLLVWTSGWQPSDSDLALSSKFVPLLYSVLESGGGFTGRPSQYVVGSPVPTADFGLRIAESTGGARAQWDVRRPDDSLVRLAGEQEAFEQTDLAGLYAVSNGGSDARFFAVNLAAEESRTDPMPVEDIERLGVSLKPTPGPQTALAAANPKSEIHNPQSKEEFWRWVLVAAFGMLLTETWLAGRPSLRAEMARDEQPTAKEEQP